MYIVRLEVSRELTSPEAGYHARYGVLGRGRDSPGLPQGYPLRGALRHVVTHAVDITRGEGWEVEVEAVRCVVARVVDIARGEGPEGQEAKAVNTCV